MFTDLYATNVVPAGDVKVGTRLRIWEDNYIVDYTSVPSPDMVKLWVSPETKEDGSLPHNPLKTTAIHRNFRFELAPE